MPSKPMKRASLLTVVPLGMKKYFKRHAAGECPKGVVPLKKIVEIDPTNPGHDFMDELAGDTYPEDYYTEISDRKKNPGSTPELRLIYSRKENPPKP